MAPGQWFWIIYVVIGICGGTYGFSNSVPPRWIGVSFVVFVLLGLLGWGIFGPPIK